jgi:hypothetical protein
MMMRPPMRFRYCTSDYGRSRNRNPANSWHITSEALPQTDEACGIVAPIAGS